MRVKLICVNVRTTGKLATTPSFPPPSTNKPMIREDEWCLLVFSLPNQQSQIEKAHWRCCATYHNGLSQHDVASASTAPPLPPCISLAISGTLSIPTILPSSRTSYPDAQLLVK